MDAGRPLGEPVGLSAGFEAAEPVLRIEDSDATEAAGERVVDAVQAAEVVSGAVGTAYDSRAWDGVEAAFGLAATAERTAATTRARVIADAAAIAEAAEEAAQERARAFAAGTLPDEAEQVSAIAAEVSARAEAAAQEAERAAAAVAAAVSQAAAKVTRDEAKVDRRLAGNVTSARSAVRHQTESTEQRVATKQVTHAESVALSALKIANAEAELRQTDRVVNETEPQTDPAAETD